MALTSVAQDIIEEQGGPVDESADALPPLDSQIHLAAPGRAPANGDTASLESPSKADDRLASMEQSMSDLTDSVRQELVLLRHALLNQKDPDDESGT